MPFVAPPANVPIVTTVSDGKVPPFNVAVTVTDVAESSSPKLEGLALRVMPVGASSSSVIVVVTDEVPRLGAGSTPTRRRRDRHGERLAGALVRSVVGGLHRERLIEPAAALVKVNVPDLAVKSVPDDRRATSLFA